LTIVRNYWINFNEIDHPSAFYKFQAQLVISFLELVAEKAADFQSRMTGFAHFGKSFSFVLFRLDFKQTD
jgi:hypothetical protein